MANVNEEELFYLPSIFNKHVELFCTFGENSLTGK